MILPLGTDRPRKRPTVATYWLIGVNVAIFIAGSIHGSPRVDPAGFERLFNSLMLDPAAPAPWQFLTYQFLHAGLMHLGANMLFLFVFGPSVEDRLGRWAFLGFYLAGGAVAGGAHSLFEFSPVVGASGSIAAVTGAFLVLFPKTHIRVLFFLFFIGVIHIQAWWVIGFAIAKDLFFQGVGADHGVALLAHLGGYSFGAFVSLALLWTGLLAREPYDLFSIGRQAHRRRVFKDLATAGRTAWTHEIGKAAPVRAERPPSAAELALAEGRAAVGRMIAEGRLDEAADAWERLCNTHGEVTLAQQSHLALANHLYSVGRRESAAVAYEIYLKRFGGGGDSATGPASGTADRQATQVRLMLALISARYLNDPIRAKRLLSEARSAGLPEDHRELAETLARELG